jgi:hypothetical protein
VFVSNSGGIKSNSIFYKCCATSLQNYCVVSCRISL